MVYRSVSELRPDPRNARTHSKKQVEQIAASIREFGFTNPILADPEGHLIAGHGRLRAARDLGLASVPVITLTDLSEPQKKALRLADNKIALNAGWDTEILRLELADLSVPEVDIDLGLTGFSVGEIDVILDERIDPDDEAIPPVPSAPACRAAISGSSVSTGLAAAMAVMPRSCARWLAKAPRSTVRSLIRLTM